MCIPSSHTFDFNQQFSGPENCGNTLQLQWGKTPASTKTLKQLSHTADVEHLKGGLTLGGFNQ
jgi:hypothetical protein